MPMVSRGIGYLPVLFSMDAALLVERGSEGWPEGQVKARTRESSALRLAE